MNSRNHTREHDAPRVQGKDRRQQHQRRDAEWSLEALQMPAPSRPSRRRQARPTFWESVGADRWRRLGRARHPSDAANTDGDARMMRAAAPRSGMDILRQGGKACAPQGAAAPASNQSAVPPKPDQAEFCGLEDLVIAQQRIAAADFRKIFDGDAGVERQPLADRLLRRSRPKGSGPDRRRYPVPWRALRQP